MSSRMALAGLNPLDFEAMRAAAFAVGAETERRRRRERILAWRGCLQNGITTVSPALLDMAAVRGVDLLRACKRLRPPAAWSGRFPISSAGGWDEVWPWAPDPRRRAHPYGRGGRIARVVRARALSPGHPDGAFTVAVDGCALSGCARVGDAELLTHGGTLRIWFHATLPATVLTAAVGMRVDRLLDHPVLTGRPYPIVRASEEEFATMFEVETGLVPFAMPWPDLVELSGAGK